jgi:cell division protein ZapA
MNTEPEASNVAAATEGPVVTVNIFGADYALRAGADPEYIRNVAAEVDRLMREIQSRVKHASATKIAVLAALQLSDQLRAVRQQANVGTQDMQELARQTDSILSRLDQTLLEVVE